MHYNFNNLYFGVVEYYHKKSFRLDVHVLCNDMDSEELFDIDLQKSILPYGEEEIYYKNSLIPFSEVLYKSRISWGYINEKDAKSIKELYQKYYFAFLRQKGINNINDLSSEEVHINSRKK